MLRHHPWVFSGAIASISDTDAVGIAKAITEEGTFIAWGWYDPKSHIPLHLLSWDEQTGIDNRWWAQTITKSVLRRKAFFSDKTTPTTSFRIIAGEADMLNGVQADVFGTLIRINISARVAWEQKDLIVSTLERLLQPALIVVVTDSAYCSIEALPDRVLFYQDGAYFTPQKRLDPIRFREDGILYEITPGKGHKGEFFCDQRENRKVIEAYCKDAVVLDGCSHTGGFTLHALRAGAAWVDMVDTNATVLKQALAHVHINTESEVLAKNSRDRVQTIKADIHRHMRILDTNKYDVMIFDLPEEVTTKSQAEKSTKEYKELLRLAMVKIKNEGVIAAFMRNEAITAEMFYTTVVHASQDANVEIQVLRTLAQADDHPIRVSFPESAVLNGLLFRVIRS